MPKVDWMTMRKFVSVGLGVALLSLGATAPAAASSDVYKQLDMFGKVFERVRQDYVDQVDEAELLEAAINGMLRSLDPHSAYLNEKSYRDTQVQTQGEFGGLGIEVTMENGLVKVVAPIDDTPASRADVRANDVITHLDGEPVLGLDLRQAVDRMRGPVDTDIRLTLIREGVETPFDVVLTRAVIRITSIRHRREGDIGYVRITSFNQNTQDGLRRAIRELREDIGDEALQGYILDLRNNPGGLLDQAITVSDAFLEQGEIVSTRGRDADETQRFNARAGDLTDGKPLVVLINGGSASASEIVAGALQDHGRAVVMGEQSFGKGSVQTIMPLGNSTALKLTTQRYYTPSGRSIQAKGIEPDIEVQQARLELVNQPQRRSEADLRGHLESGDGEEIDADARAADAEAPADYQLERALDLLQGLYVFQAAQAVTR